MRNRPSARIGLDVVCVAWGSSITKRDDDPATVDYLREQAPYSQCNGYSMRRDHCSFGRTLQEGNRMTICSWTISGTPRISSVHTLSHLAAKARYTIKSLL